VVEGGESLVRAVIFILLLIVIISIVILLIRHLLLALLVLDLHHHILLLLTHIRVLASGAFRTALQQPLTATLACHHLCQLVNHLKQLEAVVRVSTRYLQTRDVPQVHTLHDLLR
jgi:hypothetical protein